VINKQGDLVHSTPITIPRSIFMHDFAVTEKYTLFLDFPITLDIGRAISGGPAVDFEPQYGSRIGVMPRYGSDADVRWFDVKTGVVIHTANAWDEGDEVVLQASRSNTADIAGAGTSEGNNLQENQGQLYEWRINLISGEVTERNLSDTPCDFTRVNDNYACFKTRYVYAGIFNTERAFTFDGVMKYDNESGVTAEFRYGPHRHGGEAVFAPRVGSASEDDGYLVCFIHDEADNQSECLIIDAQTIEAGPVATIMMPFRVPYGFHAGWVST
jgi:carotenoid cleavage dioxygenase-like enzyme